MKAVFPGKSLKMAPELSKHSILSDFQLFLYNSYNVFVQCFCTFREICGLEQFLLSTTIIFVLQQGFLAR